MTEIKERGEVLVRGAAGEPMRLNVTFMDNCRQKNMESSLREGEEKFRSVFANAVIGFSMTTPSGEFVDANPAYCRLTGFSLTELQNLTLADLIHPEDLAENLRLIGEMTDGRITHFVIENRYLHKDGHSVWVQKSVSLVRNAENNPLWVIGLVEDISERKRAEQALRDSETRFRMVVENSWDGIHQLDLRTGRYLFMSPSRERLTGFRCAERMRSMAQFAMRIHPEDRLVFDTYLAWIIGGEEVEKTIEYRWRVQSGAYRWFSDSRRAVFDENGKAVALIGVSWDITESKNIQATLEKSRDELEKTVAERTAELELRNRQLHALSQRTIRVMENDRKVLSKEIHDRIGGSLSAIKMMLETQLDKYLVTLLPEEEIRSLKQIIAYLVDTIKQSKRISYHMRSLALDDFGLTAAITENIKNFKQFYTGIEVDARIDVSRADIPDELTTVIYRIVQEALNNVGKHSGAGKVIIHLTESENRLSLRVEDDGRGFDVRQVLNRAESISSFGLRSMKERVELCNGIFRLVSQPGRGTSLFASIKIAPSVEG